MDKDNKTKSKIVQTYAEDMAKVIEDDKSGLIKKIIHDEEKHEIEKKNLSPESKKNQLFMFIGLVFIILGSTILFFFLFMRDVPTVPVERQFTPIIFNDKSVFLEVKDFKKEEIAQLVSNEVNTTEVKNGAVEGIYLTFDKQIVGLRHFISLIHGDLKLKADQPRPDMSVDGIFVYDNFLMGVVNNQTEPNSSAGKDFFILIKMRSIADIFDSLRNWENKIFLDLHSFFGVSISPETKDVLTKEFQDGVVKNKNARILYDKNNKIVMMYVLVNENFVVITNTENAINEIMLRLASSKITK